jgi:hypothetical protein
MTGRSRFDPQQRQKNFSSSLCVQTGSGAHPAFSPVGTGGSFPRAEAQPGCDADHTPPSSAKVKKSRMSRRYTSSSPSVFLTCSGMALAFNIYIFFFALLVVTPEISCCSQT